VRLSSLPSAHDDCKVFTPEPLARVMAGLLRDRPGDRWLEPCVGKGVFLTALRAAGVAPSRITAIELDHHAGLEEWCGQYRPGTDFLAWSYAGPGFFDRIIGNPPYLPLHRVLPEIRGIALKLCRPGGGQVPPKANCWYAFMCACLNLLRPHGGMCFVLPSAWEYADYAADLRDRLPQMFARFEVYRSETSLFRGVLDGCVVLIADGFGEANRVNRKLLFSDPERLIAALGTANSSASEVIEPRAKSDISHNTDFDVIRFGDVARVRIGGVTGDSTYFLLTERQRAHLGLPHADVRPVLTRARHLEGAAVHSREWNLLREANERVWLFWPSVRRGRRVKAVMRYIEFGEAAGCPLKEKIRVRDPWFRTRMPPMADGFMSGMSPVGPLICLNRMNGLSATNTLYTIHFHAPMKLYEKATWCMALASTTAAMQHATKGRRYSDGLLKFEPRDVMDLLVPKPAAFYPGALSIYERILNAIRTGRIETARCIADSYVKSADGSARYWPGTKDRVKWEL
jgi:adenine-specific DNA-methyltransferase